ncbi:MAG: amino acid adenylation domain-containing protein, partial [Pyrinomonadaceae bacterium]
TPTGAEQREREFESSLTCAGPGRLWQTDAKEYLMTYESVQEMFSRVAAGCPTAPAVERGGRSLTYAELEAESNRLANFLAGAGAVRGTVVGLFTADPAQVIAGILGVLKAGAVFVPLDPSFPEHRLGVLSGQARPEFFITQATHLLKLGRVLGEAGQHTRVICVDGQAEGAEFDASVLEVLTSYEGFDRVEHPGLPSDADAPCSVYFTSGSTGKPKAILGRLKGIDHFVRWEIGAVGSSHGTRVSQLASPSFDGFLKDAFVPLCSGGVVCAPESRDVVLDSWSLADWLDAEGVEVLHCVPSVFRSLINQGLSESYFGSMRWVVLTGEPLYPADVKRWMEVFGERIKLWNIYGTTETSMSKFAHEVTREDAERPSIPVGKPIDGVEVMVINSSGRLCGLGAVGEVHIKTPYRSHGYYGEPEMTAEVFVPNPFGSDPSDLVHRTGDFGRLLPGGELELLGRRDQQVKVRGVRVELGEVENLLRGHEAVADVAVVDREDGEGGKALVAYVTLSNGAGAGALRGYLMERLPEAMVPSAFVEMESLPRTLGGKIDRKALPALEQVQAQREAEGEVARSPLEEIVAGIWREVLRLPSVKRDGNFFNLGGHSLLVTQVLARVREFLEVELPVRSLFEAPTVEEFSRLIEEKFTEGRRADLTPIERVPREGELPLSYSQRRMWFFEHLSGGTCAFNVVLDLRLKGRLNIAALEQTFGEIIRRHESLRTTFPAVGDSPAQVINPPAPFSLPVVDLSTLPSEEREGVAARAAQGQALRRFDLGRGPLLRLALLRLAAEEHVVVCTMHHIIGDGQSFEVVIAEMSRLYGALCGGEPSPLSELEIQYADYAAWQRGWLRGEELEGRLGYWRGQLGDAPRRLNLPHRKGRARVQRFKGAEHEVRVNAELTKALRELSQREGVTLFMTMLSAFVVLLNLYTDNEDIVVGSAYANRERAEAERLIGILANTLVLRVDVSGAETFRDVLRRVREVCLDAYTYQLPPELLREGLGERGEERESLFDVWFQLEKERKEKFDMPGLDATPYIEGKEVTRFELSLGLGEWEDEVLGTLEYDDDLFTAETTARMVEGYLRVLALMAEDPERNLSGVSLASETEDEQLRANFAANLEA